MSKKPAKKSVKIGGKSVKLETIQMAQSNAIMRPVTLKKAPWDDIENSKKEGV